MSREEFLEELTLDTLHYAKRQMTWLKRKPGIRWIEAREPLDGASLAEQILKMYNGE